MKFYFYRIVSFISIIFFLVAILGLNQLDANPISGKVSGKNASKPINIPINIMIEDGEFGDCKLLSMNGSSYYIGSRGNKISILNIASNQPKFVETHISSNWLSALVVAPDTAVVVTSSFLEKQVRIYKININTLSYELISTIGDGSKLRIDPSIVRTDKGWFLTLTEIEGTVNNADLKHPNGRYIVSGYSSSDLINWELSSEILDRNNNLEDVRLIYRPNSSQLKLLFEQEEVNYGSSSLRIISSMDEGKTWSNEEVVISNNSDNEPAAIIINNNTEYVLFSSDLKNKGLSYNGSHAYYVHRDISGNVNWSSPINVNIGERLLLMDAIFSTDHLLRLVAVQDYGNDDKLLINSILLDKI